MNRLLATVLLALGALAGCGGGSSQAPPPPVVTPSPTPAPGTTLIVPNAAAAVDTWTVTTNGNVAPSSVLTGTTTGPSVTFVLPTAVAVDAARKIYVTEFNINTLYVFPPWATGSTPPTETISGPATGIAGPDGIGVDAAGNMYVSNRNGNSVTVFAPGANGNAAWVRAVVGPLTTLTNPQQIVVNPAGDFYVAAVQRQRLPARRSRQSSNPHTRRARSAAVEALRNGAPSFFGRPGALLQLS